MVERLIKEGYEVYISSPYGEFIDEFTAIGCQFIDTQIERHGKNPVKDFKLMKKYITIMKQVKPLVDNNKEKLKYINNFYQRLKNLNYYKDKYLLPFSPFPEPFFFF